MHIIYIQNNNSRNEKQKQQQFNLYLYFDYINNYYIFCYCINYNNVPLNNNTLK